MKEAESQLNKARLSEQSELYSYISALAELEYILDLPAGWKNKSEDTSGGNLYE